MTFESDDMITAVKTARGNLTAAAPQLLEAAEELLFEVKRLPQREQIIMILEIRQLEAAIEAAKGNDWRPARRHCIRAKD